MRQAGRYMEEYREVRGQTSFLELCKNPQLCSEIMCTAVERLGVDAAIIFSDLLPILEPMGLELEFAKGEGPVIYNPVRAAADVDRVVELEDLGSLDFVFETVRQTRADLPSHLPLIGFAGAPVHARQLRHRRRRQPQLSAHQDRSCTATRAPGRTLMERLARSITRYLNAQIAAGAQCVQLFDSWVGCLGVDDYRRYVLPYVKFVIDQHHARRPRHQLRHRQPGAAAAAGRSRRPRHRHRLAHPPRRRLENRRPRPRRARQPRPARPARRPNPKSAAAPSTFSTRPPAAPATSSTSATASCSKRRSKTPSPWSMPCMNSSRR